MQKRRVGTALLLIALGVLFLLDNYVDLGETFLAIVGVFLLAAYFALGHNPGFLIPGGILTGLGLGIYATGAGFLERDEMGGSLIMLGLGAGFLLIWVLERRQRWAIIPGSIISGLGALSLLTAWGGIIPRDLLLLVEDWWPLILVMFGLWILYQQLVHQRR